MGHINFPRVSECRFTSRSSSTDLRPAEIISKFACLLHRGSPVVLHGDGKNTRRYLYASDAVDAFDTILHRGQIGEIYNVASRDEISNFDLSMELLSHFDISTPSARTWIEFTKDRPFNDKRYAVDSTKLRRLGWEQKTSFKEGLKITVDWYREFGKDWWGDVDSVLTPFPVVREGDVHVDGELRKNTMLGVEGKASGSVTGKGVGVPKKRPLDEDDKENADGQERKVTLGNDWANGDGTIL
jgi:hypothetical protein